MSTVTAQFKRCWNLIKYCIYNFWIACVRLAITTTL